MIFSYFRHTTSKVLVELLYEIKTNNLFGAKLKCLSVTKVVGYYLGD